MFEPSAASYVDLESSQLIHLYKSLNEPQVSPGSGIPAEPASSYIMTVVGRDKLAGIYIGLYFPRSQKRMLYERTGISPKELKDEIVEAESFAGEMGFIVDNCHYSTSTDLEKRELIRNVPFFYEDLDTFLQSLSTSEIQAQIHQVEGQIAREESAGLESNFLEQYVRVLSML